MSTDVVPKIAWGTLVRVRTFYVTGGRGTRHMGIVVGYEPKRWDKRTRPYRVMFEDVPKRIFKVAESDLEVLCAHDEVK